MHGIRATPQRVVSISTQCLRIGLLRSPYWDLLRFSPSIRHSSMDIICSILLTRGRMPVRILSKQPWVCTLVSKTSHKTATKFHYGFNIRQTSNVFQRLLVSMPENSILRTNSFCFGSPKVNACMAIGSCLQRTWQNSMTWLSRNVKKSSPHSPLPSILQKKIPSRCSFALLPRAFKLLLTIK